MQEYTSRDKLRLEVKEKTVGNIDNIKCTAIDVKTIKTNIKCHLQVAVGFK